jgi:hypothetical protein
MVIIYQIFAYCTDFIINLANITSLSYYEINFIFFIVIYPLLLIVTPIIYFFQKFKLNKIKKMAQLKD